MEEDAEGQWESLLSTMAPSCLKAADMLAKTKAILQATKDQYFTNQPCPGVDVIIPPTIETGLATIALRAGTNNAYPPPPPPE